VPQRDRISVEIGDIRDRIETCRGDVAWKELPMAAKLRVLIIERLEQIESQNREPSDPQN
jgi:hypothetical protein